MLVLLALLIAGSILESSIDSTFLEKMVLQKGRVVLSSTTVNINDLPDEIPELGGHMSDTSNPSNVIDGDLNSPVFLKYPQNTTEGVYLLMDMALSHFPANAEDIRGPNSPEESSFQIDDLCINEEDHLRNRKPAGLYLYNGWCTHCDENTFHMFSRMKDIELIFYERRANDPDVEYLIPPVSVMETRQVTLRDGEDPVFIPLSNPHFPVSETYPQNVTYLIIKVVVHTIYEGELHPELLAVREAVYADRGCGEDILFEWN